MTVVIDFNFYLHIAQILIGVVTIFYGRRLYWLWIGFEAFLLGERLASFALYRSTDLLRFSAAALIGLLFALLALRFRRHVLALGGFLSAGVLAMIVTGRFLPIVPGGAALAALVIAGSLGGLFVWRNPDLGTIILSAVTGTLATMTIVRRYAGSNLILEPLAFVVIAGLGIWFQGRQWRQSGSPDTMKKNPRLLHFFVVLLLAGCSNQLPGDIPLTPAPDAAATVAPKARPELTLKPDDRILVLAPHPDDETLASGGLIQQAQAMGLPVHVAFLTNGDNNEWAYSLYRGALSLDPTSVLEGGLVRHQEALNATAALGLKPEAVTFLGYPDFGTLRIWLEHWRNREPLRAMMTERNAVPYTTALSPNAPYRGESILADLTTVLRDFKPTKIVVSDPGDQNPDHQALYLFTRAALWNLRDAINPQIYTYLVHYGRFPMPRGLLKDAPLEPPANFDVGDIWHALRLTPAQVDGKLAALQQHKTQWDTSSRYLESFVRSNELFAARGDDLKVTPNAPVILNESIALRGARRPLEQLTPQERAKYVGAEIDRISLDGDTLVISATLAQPLPQDVNTTAYIFGYRDDRPFGEMPKLHVEVGESGHKLYDAGKPLRDDSVQVTSTPNAIEIRVPLASLGSPQRVLLGLRVQTGEVPLESEPWRTLDLPGR
jgi:LmbE family N-acetylglucosaminyl deacetylase